MATVKKDGVEFGTSDKAVTAATHDHTRAHSAVGALPTDAVVTLSAADLSSISPGGAVTEWKSSPPAGPALTFTPVPGVNNDGMAPIAPVLVVDSEGRRAVSFDGRFTALGALVRLSPETTTIAVVMDEGTHTMFGSVVHFDTDRGLGINPTDCATGLPVGSGPCNTSVIARSAPALCVQIKPTALHFVVVQTRRCARKTFNTPSHAAFQFSHTRMPRQIYHCN